MLIPINRCRPFFSSNDLRISRHRPKELARRNACVVSRTENEGHSFEKRIKVASLRACSNEIKQYSDEKGGRAIVRITSVKDNGIFLGQLLEAKSIPDNGKSLSLNIFGKATPEETERMMQRTRMINEKEFSRLIKEIKDRPCTATMAMPKEEAFERCKKYGINCNKCLRDWIMKPKEAAYGPNEQTGVPVQRLYCRDRQKRRPVLQDVV